MTETTEPHPGYWQCPDCDSLVPNGVTHSCRMSCGHPRSALRWSRWPELVPGAQTTHWCYLCQYAAEQELAAIHGTGPENVAGNEEV